ncbi:hypothetical protein N7533_001890 [Penicillium manginii]|uniref:uncharacterized protein n=1 Tax=Penicillium manginii TaxID=203109 RepID=UPI002548CCF0|nr:uncharacterized protein N7533_001890 [Penicillium manginii]KAJ5763209.1 hypothetical protein N7533_001890 [Penicillium manginii]
MKNNSPWPLWLSEVKSGRLSPCSVWNNEGGNDAIVNGITPCSVVMVAPGQTKGGCFNDRTDVDG